MRTTVRLPDDLYDQVRAAVSARGLTVTAFWEEALRRALVEPDEAPGEPYRVRPFRGQGLQPGWTSTTPRRWPISWTTMLALDVDVIVSALREDAPDHEAVRGWLETAVADPEPVGISDAVLTGALRVLTHPRVFKPPTPLDHALSELGRLRDSTGVVRLVPGRATISSDGDLARFDGLRWRRPLAP